MAEVAISMLVAPIAGNIHVSLGKGDLPTATLSTPGGASAEVCITGAHVTNWRLRDGSEQLFMSSASNFVRGSAIRGGVPICFPQFSDRGSLQKHGFARTSDEWEIESMSSERGIPRLVLCLADSDATRAVWPNKFQLRYTVELHDQKLCMQMEVKNLGDTPIEFTTALHTYFRVADVTRTRIRGLGGLQYQDNTMNGAQMEEAEAELLSIRGEVDRVYLNAPDTLDILDGDLRRLQLRKHGFRDAVLWNLGPEKASDMSDLGRGEWKHFVCVEAGAIGSPVSLSPGETFVASQEFWCCEAAP
eukprot:6189942-Pleurochrysis_carterae.AAC.3